jgi:CBS domain-containing protein
LLPIAREGLKNNKVDKNDISKYLDIIEERAKSHMNGARWQLRAYTKLLKETNRDEALCVLTAAIVKNQEEGVPVHKWKLPELDILKEYKPSQIFVEEFMETDLFTVQKDDIIELVAEMMDWRKIRYTPVEDTKGNLVGLVSSRLILRHFIRDPKLKGKMKMVKDIMIENPLTIAPDATIIEAMAKMRENQIGSLPVVKNGELIGIITEMDFLKISGRLIERLENKK